jgi:thiol-disulfide isomerase/thioredoxin
MKIMIPSIAALLFVVSCKEQKKINEIIIEGQVKNIPDGKIYLTEAHQWQIPLDSTQCINGYFIFKIIPDTSFFPYMAGIHFPDSSKPSKTGGLIFRNYMIGADSMKYAGDAFYLEKGYTRIEGDNQKPPYLRIFAGKETDVFYKNQSADFGWLGNIDSAKRLSRINSFKNEIKKNPFSYFLLQSIYDAKEQYSKKEIMTIVSLFNNDVQNSKLAENIATSLKNRPSPGEPYPNLYLLNAENKRQNIIDPNSKLTMIVFWASWCSPCRMEIPLLKEIKEAYKEKGLNIVSVSMDDNGDNWKKALSQERMNWPQYIVDRDKLEIIKQQFNFRAIPFVVFTDNAGKEIMKFTGYDKEQKKNYEAVIKKYIE